jgi:hypothetical protein
MKWQLAVLLLLTAQVAHAEPWLCTDRDGVRTYSYEPESAKRKNCVHKPIPSSNVWRKTPRIAREESKSPEFPTVDARTQKHRDADRRRILERELAEEKKALADAMKQLEEHKRVKSTNHARAEDPLKPLQDRIRIHLTNIANLERELGQKG